MHLIAGCQPPQKEKSIECNYTVTVIGPTLILFAEKERKHTAKLDMHMTFHHFIFVKFSVDNVIIT